MKILCSVSGEEFKLSEDFEGEPVIKDIHPIFRLPAKELLLRAKKYGHRYYSSKEEKLLFLALLNATKAVLWDTHANPTEATVTKFMEPMFKLMAWWDAVTGQSLILPQFRVSSQNQGLENIGSFIEACYICRNEWMAPSHRKVIQDLLDTREHTLQKQIASGRDTNDYAKQLADWAAKATTVKGKEWMRDIIRDVFLLREDVDIVNAHKQDVEDVYIWVKDQLYGIPYAIGHSSGISGSIAQQAIRHITRIYTINKKGWSYVLGQSFGGPAGTFKMKLDSLESEEEKKEHIQVLEAEVETVSDEPPKRKDYLTNKDWMQAFAKWRLNSDKKQTILDAKKDL